jgi:hypothetical protein
MRASRGLFVLYLCKRLHAIMNNNNEEVRVREMMFSYFVCKRLHKVFMKY